MANQPEKKGLIRHLMTRDEMWRLRRLASDNNTTIERLITDYMRKVLMKWERNGRK
jgi:hypothetical protein